MATVASLRKRVDALKRVAQEVKLFHGWPALVEVRLSEPLDVQEAQIAEAEAKALAGGWCLPPGVDEWFLGCGVGPMLVIVELDDRADVAA